MTDTSAAQAAAAPPHTADRAVPDGSATARLLGWLGMAGGVIAAVSVLTLDAVVGSRPLRGRAMRLQTISEYVYSPGAVAFVIAVLALAAGSAAVAVGLVRRGLVRPFAPGSVLMTLWVIGLVGIVAFPKHNWTVGPSAAGTLHRVASLLAFVALPFAVLLVARWRRHRTSIAARSAFWLAIGGLCALAVLLGAIVVAAAGGGRWWQLIPLGIVERCIAGFEVAAVIALGAWLVRSDHAPGGNPDHRT